jgi:hypothetical protein
MTIHGIQAAMGIRERRRQVQSSGTSLLSSADVTTPLWVIPVAKGGDRIKAEPAK